MSLPLRTDLTVYCGGVWDDQWTWLDANGSPMNLSGWTARMDVRAQTDISPASAGTPILQLTSGAGTIVLGGVAGTVTLAVPASTTASLQPTTGGSEHVYDRQARPVTMDATIRAIAQKLGEHGWSVIRSEDLAELRIRAQIGDTHGAFRRDALDAHRRIREATNPTATRRSRYFMALDAWKIADAFIRRHDVDGESHGA